MAAEELLARTMVDLADTLVDDFDVVELLTLLAHRWVEVLDVDAAGLMLVAPEGDLRVVASSSEEMRVVELFELQSAGRPLPGLATAPAKPCVNQKLRAVDGRWPRIRARRARRPASDPRTPCPCACGASSSAP